MEGPARGDAEGPVSRAVSAWGSRFVALTVKAPERGAPGALLPPTGLSRKAGRWPLRLCAFAAPASIRAALRGGPRSELDSSPIERTRSCMDGPASRPADTAPRDGKVYRCYFERSDPLDAMFVAVSWSDERGWIDVAGQEIGRGWRLSAWSPD